MYIPYMPKHCVCFLAVGERVRVTPRHCQNNQFLCFSELNPNVKESINLSEDSPLCVLSTSRQAGSKQTTDDIRNATRAHKHIKGPYSCFFCFFMLQPFYLRLCLKMLHHRQTVSENHLFRWILSHLLCHCVLKQLSTHQLSSEGDFSSGGNSQCFGAFGVASRCLNIQAKTSFSMC